MQLWIARTLSQNSNRLAKENINVIDHKEILQKITTLPISQWQYKGDSVQHIGPMAQDFYAAFNYGPSNKSISALDVDGVTLASIKALAERCEQLSSENEQLRSNYEVLQNEMKKISDELSKIRDLIRAPNQKNKVK